MFIDMGRLLKTLSCAALTLVAGEAHAQDQPVLMSVKPELCITDKRTGNCEASFLVRWESEHIDQYCLGDDVSPAPLRCWQQVSAGKFDEDRVVTRSFIYRLILPDVDQPVAEVKVELMTIESPDRRRRRRSRHAWSIM
jgi:hypothetical protein